MERDECLVYKHNPQAVIKRASIPKNVTIFCRRFHCVIAQLYQSSLLWLCEDKSDYQLNWGGQQETRMRWRNITRWMICEQSACASNQSAPVLVRAPVLIGQRQNGANPIKQINTDCGASLLSTIFLWISFIVETQIKLIFLLSW